MIQQLPALFLQLGAWSMERRKLTLFFKLLPRFVLQKLNIWTREDSDTIWR
jgi:hypothetical protein